ncbi:hypothetical protein ACQUEP_08620 [Enterococcus casseliflavus]|uniref:hypothetical protein n=1 Tax=Enterococcus casseliflavus TaxID=37734 RepID=UPI0028911B75|nr:hypothetical protein [Enterococcus casseliflavus]MDT2986844.1 hypothetical protein [Enterococcus casseliflavus]
MKTIYFFPLLIFLSFSLTGCTLIDELLDETRQSSSSLETAVTSQSLSMDSEASSSFSTEKQTTSTTIDISSSSDSLDQQVSKYRRIHLSLLLLRAIADRIATTLE